MRDRARRILACLCLFACCPCCFPCYVCALRSRKRRRRQEEHDAREEHNRMGPRSPEDVHPLKWNRRRRISIPAGYKSFADENSGGSISDKAEASASEKEGAPTCEDVEGTSKQRAGTTGEQKEATLREEKGITENEECPIARPEDTAEQYAEKMHKVDHIASATNEEAPLTYTQNQSPLFSKLPPEIRQLIWRATVGDYNIYLGVLPGEGRVRHCKIFPNRGLMGSSADVAEQDRLMNSHYFMPLLRSCRRVYTEAVALLYTSNTFLLSKPSTLLSLSASTLLHSFDSITRVNVKWTPQLQHGITFSLTPHHLKTWRLTSTLLASMKSLKYLDLVFWDRSLYGTPATWDNIDELLEMLGKVRLRQKGGRYRVRFEQWEPTFEEVREREVVKGAGFELVFGRTDRSDNYFWWFDSL